LKNKLIYAVLFFSSILHLFVAFLGSRGLIGDENYYVPYSLDMLHGVASNFEHPPLVKAIVALSVSVLGNNWFAWRIPIILFAVLATWLTYKVAKEFVSERAATFASVMLTLSIIFLFLGSTALLDVPAVTLGLAGVYLALKKRYVWSGLMFGLSFLSKELAVLMFLATIFYLYFTKVKGKQILLQFITALSSSLLGLWIYELVYQPIANGVLISNPVSQIYYMVMHYFTLIRIHSWYPPISWVTPFGVNAWNPLTLFSLYRGNTLIATWGLQPNVAIEYFMFPLLIILPILYWKRKESLALLSWLWLAFTYLPWLFMGFFVKTEINTYIVYSVPFLAIGSAYLWTTLSNKKLKYVLAITQFTVGLIWFIYYLVIYPLGVK
jgi:4-amino-4-deoxy-L-arabinose transferase-like glycosyltransferase